MILHSSALLPTSFSVLNTRTVWPYVFYVLAIAQISLFIETFICRHVLLLSNSRPFPAVHRRWKYLLLRQLGLTLLSALMTIILVNDGIRQTLLAEDHFNALIPPRSSQLAETYYPPCRKDACFLFHEETPFINLREEEPFITLGGLSFRANSPLCKEWSCDIHTSFYVFVACWAGNSILLLIFFCLSERVSGNRIHLGGRPVNRIPAWYSGSIRVIRQVIYVIRNGAEVVFSGILGNLLFYSHWKLYISAINEAELLQDGHSDRNTLRRRVLLYEERGQHENYLQVRKELFKVLSMPADRRGHLVQSVVRHKHSQESIWTNSVQFSSRFSAIWAHFEDVGTLWVCVMDGESSVFALQTNSSVESAEIEQVALPTEDRTCLLDRLNLTKGHINWSALLQSAADFQDSDNAIRAVLISCIVCTRPKSGNSCVSETLVLKKLQTLSAQVHYDIPVDFDLMTALADPLRIENQLMFKCGLGTVAKAVRQEKGICHLELIEDSAEILQVAETIDPGKEDLPILYGYGHFLNSEIPCTTARVSHIRERIPRKGGTSKLLLAVAQTAQNIELDGKLDLPTAAAVIFATKGCFLGSRTIGSGTGKTMRKIRGDVLLVGKDGIYKSSRFIGMAVEGSLEVNLFLVKVGMKLGRAPDKRKDTRIESLSEIAEHILGRQYKKQYVHDYPVYVVLGPDDIWSDEVAVCNTLVALLCRKFGPFTGFSKVTGTPSSVYGEPNDAMDADIFLPWLSVWEHPRAFFTSCVSLRLKMLCFRALTYTFPEDENETVIFWTTFWGFVVNALSYLTQCPRKFVHKFITDLKHTTAHPEREICFLSHRILACWSPDIVCNDATIRVAAKVP